MRNTIFLGAAISLSVFALLSSCASIPKKAQPLQNFEINKYLGNWYEIARFDYRFEKNLDNVMAQYSLNNKKNVDVVNSGYNFKKEKWVSAKGKAKFRSDKEIATLKVSFFGPFYSGYNVIALDDNYKYALVAGNSLSYLWVLSREKSIPENIKLKYLKIAEDIGYDTSKLIWVGHNKKSPFEEKE